MTNKKFLQKAVAMLSNPASYHLNVDRFDVSSGGQEYFFSQPTFYTKNPFKFSHSINILVEYDCSTCLIKRFLGLYIDEDITELDAASYKLYKKLLFLIKLRLKQTDVLFLFNEQLDKYFHVVINI